MTPDDLARILDELGQRLGPTGEHVFALAVRQVYIESGLLALGGLLALAVGVVTAVGGRRYYRAAVVRHEGPHTGSYYGSGPDRDTFLITWGGAAAFALFVGVAMLGAALPSFLNPEYAALRDILGAIGR